MKKLLTYISLAAIISAVNIFGLSATSEVIEPVYFSDVDPEDTHYLAIRYLGENGISQGYSDGTFKSWEQISRAEALKMLLIASTSISANEELPVPTEAPFPDVPVDSWYAPYVAFALENEIISGHPDGNFYPDSNIQLVEALKIFLEASPHTGYPQPEEHLVNDTPLDAWFTKYTSYGIARGLLDIWPDNTIRPAQEIDRGYLAEIIYRRRYFQKGYRFGKATFYGAALQGNLTASGERFDLNLMTAAHKTLPFGTIVEVTNLANGKTVQVKINDRGPYGPGRVIDLSTAAFTTIADRWRGVIHVQYKIVQ